MLKYYKKSQKALLELKVSIIGLLELSADQGLTNAEIGIYAGHKGHVGHISRTMLAIMGNEGVIEQESESKRWTIISINKKKISKFPPQN